jgi:hypothetical protein
VFDVVDRVRVNLRRRILLISANQDERMLRGSGNEVFFATLCKKESSKERNVRRTSASSSGPSSLFCPEENSSCYLVFDLPISL